MFDKVSLLLIPLTGVGVILSWKHNRDVLLLVLVFITFPVVYYLTHASYYRFRFLIEGLMLVFVAYTSFYLLQFLRFVRG